MTIRDPKVGEVFVKRGTWWKITRRTKYRVQMVDLSYDTNIDSITISTWRDFWIPDLVPERPLTEAEIEAGKIDHSLPLFDRDEDG